MLTTEESIALAGAHYDNPRELIRQVEAAVLEKQAQAAQPVEPAFDADESYADHLEQNCTLGILAAQPVEPLAWLNHQGEWVTDSRHRSGYATKEAAIAAAIEQRRTTPPDQTAELARLRACETAERELREVVKMRDLVIGEADKSHRKLLAEIEKLREENAGLRAQIEALAPRKNVSPPSEALVLHKMRYHYWDADGDDPADFELFEQGVECETCIDVAIVRQDRLDELREAVRVGLEALEMVAADVKTTPNAYEAQRQAIAKMKGVL